MNAPYSEMNQYQKDTARTLNPNMTEKELLTMLGWGIHDESGEVIDHLKKRLFHHHPKESMRDAVCKEIGDLMWYVVRTAAYFGIDMSEIPPANIEKLRKRYPEGFSPERSIHREGES